MDGAVLQWWAHSLLFVLVFIIVSSPSSVTPLEEFYGVCPRTFMISYAGVSGGVVVIMGLSGGLKSLPQMNSV